MPHLVIVQGYRPSVFKCARCFEAALYESPKTHRMNDP